MHKPTLAVLAASLALAGCADKLLSDEHIRDKTAMALNQPSAAIAIADRRYDGFENTYYTARTPRGSFHCILNGGSVLQFGFAYPPACERQ